MSVNVMTSLSTELLNRGMDTLSEILNGVDDIGILFIQDIIEEEINAKITMKTINKLSNEAAANINAAVIKCKSELETLASKHCDISSGGTCSSDSADARDMQVELVNAYAERSKSQFGLWLSANFVYIIGTVLVGIIMFYIYAITFHSADIPENRVRFVDQTLGNLFSILGAIVGFFFGSVRDSKKK